MKDAAGHSELKTGPAVEVAQDPVKKETSADRLVYFAAERTLLSWVRAALGLMALGFVVDRFGLILKKRIPPGLENGPGDPFSSWIGILLVAVGVAANVTAAVRYLRFEKSYHRRLNTRPGHGLSLGIFLTLTVAALGVIIVLFLILALK